MFPGLDFLHSLYVDHDLPQAVLDVRAVGVCPKPPKIEPVLSPALAGKVYCDVLGGGPLLLLA